MIHFLLTRTSKCSTIVMTPKNEALNLVMSKVAPKHLVFSRSHSLKDRVALVVALDSIGYFKTITTLLQYILHQNSFKLKPVESLWAKEQDHFCQYMKKCKASIQYKYQRAAERKRI